MPIGKSIQTPIIGATGDDKLTRFVQSFMDFNETICNESAGNFDIFEEPLKVMRRQNLKNQWKKFFTEGYFDTENDQFRKDPLMNSPEIIADQKAMVEQQFENDVTALMENASLGSFNPVIGMVFPMHKNIMMNMVFDKGAIQKVVAEGPKMTLSMEYRIMTDTAGNRIDMFAEQNKLTAAMDASNPTYNITLNLPENEATDVLGMCGGTSQDALSIRTHISHVKLTNVYIAEGDKMPDAVTGIISSKSKIATAADAKLYAEVWFPVKIEFKTGYTKFERTFQQPLNFTVRKNATEVEVRKDVLAGTMDHNKFNIFGSGSGVVSAVRLAASLDASNAMGDSCRVGWEHDDILIEIPDAKGLTVTVSPQEIKDLAALYSVNQVTKIMSLFKTVLANYKDDKIRMFLDDSYDRMPDANRGFSQFDFAVPENYALDHVEYRYKTFFDHFDTEITRMLQVLNDPNMVVTVFGDPDLIRKMTPQAYAYQSPSSIGPVDIDYKRTVVTSDNRVYQFIGSDKLRWNDQLVVILCPRGTSRVTYRIFDYQMYVSNEIRDSKNPSLPAIHAFERWTIEEYQPVQSRVEILNRSGRRPKP